MLQKNEVRELGLHTALTQSSHAHALRESSCPLYFFPQSRDPSTKLGFSTFVPTSVVPTGSVAGPCLNPAEVCGGLLVQLPGSGAAPREAGARCDLGREETSSEEDYGPALRTCGVAAGGGGHMALEPGVSQRY